MKIRTPPKRGFNFEYMMWLFTRLSALAMYLLAIIGIGGALLMGAREQMNMADLVRWTFMPNPNHVLNTNVPDIAAWQTLFWQVIGITFLLFAGSHGLHGLLNVVEDYLTHTKVRLFLRILVVFLWLLMSAIGIYVILNS